MLVFTFIRRDASGKSRIERSEGYGTPEEVISWQRELSHALWAFRNTRGALALTLVICVY